MDGDVKKQLIAGIASSRFFHSSDLFFDEIG